MDHFVRRPSDIRPFVCCLLRFVIACTTCIPLNTGYMNIILLHMISLHTFGQRVDGSNRVQFQIFSEEVHWNDKEGKINVLIV